MESKVIVMLFTILVVSIIIPTHSKRIQLRNSNISPPTSTKRIGLSVGTIPGVGNCAVNGTTTKNYEMLGERNAIVPAGEHVTRFYVYLDYSEVGEDQAEIGEAEVKTSSPTECSAFIHGESHLGGSIDSQDEPRELDVVYTCRKDTKVDVLLTIPVVGYAPILLQWTKVCSDKFELEDLDVSFQKSFPLPSSKNSSIVVSSGKVNELWENATNVFSGRALELKFELSTQRTIPSDSVFRKLGSISASANPPIVIPTTYLVFNEETISLPNPDIIKLLDSAADRGQESIDTRVHLECLAEGMTEIVVKIRTRTPFDPYRNTVFRFQYSCGGPHPRLLVSSKRYVMTHQNKVLVEDADVAKSGTLCPRWANPEDIAMILDEQQEAVRFYYALESHAELVADKTPFTMMVSDIRLSNHATKCELDNTLDKVETSWRYFTIRCVCHSFEASETVVSVSLRPVGYTDVDIRYVKKCGGHKWGANVRVLGSQVRVEGSDDLPEWIDVVRNGVTTLLWQRNFRNHSAFMDTSVAERGTTFTVVLGVQSPFFENEKEERNASSSSSHGNMQRIGPVVVSVSDPNVLQVSLLGSLVLHSENNWLRLNTPYGLHVKYECKEKGKWVLIEIKIPLLEPTFEPMVFSYYYHCETLLESIGL